MLNKNCPGNESLTIALTDLRYFSMRTEYMKSSILYDRILRARIIPLNNSDTSLSIDINSPSKSLRVSYSFLRKKGVPLNLPVILKNSLTLK